ncbi:ABC-type Fe3+/spermidine/putrescine transport system ATPase subunit [Maribacter caenipelagi]|uniref:ABC-type Fe3+/spermidine/putrescine transport system ATPase subunit n=1 Tax=Maribacter caenipelagi TaxID=1447781 RepID=A0A4R7DBH5_9FLAO|nr:ABC transporter ATP-binding protein [Maribacter caenipelagi]TDS18500.1 ABC-type Fe3+/spermidine/putrescine transport system ATPase subunit [Maribacter caenipelagi]
MLRVENLSFSYDKLPILESINLRIQRGEHVAIIGESGCGKSTLLKLMYGLMDLEQGEIFWEDEQILGPAYNLVPGMPFMKYLSQDFDLMPFITVSENISQYLSVFYPDELKERTEELLELIEMTEFADKKVKTLSGGQQQRVALARVLAQKPEVLLLDEPFSHIDNFLKNSLRRNIFNYLKENLITTIVATHDVHDVLPFADRAVVLRDKDIIARARPMELYKNPKNLYVASLFGEANMISIDVLKTYANTKRKIIVYAHEFRVSPSSGLKVIVEKAYPMGSHYLTESKNDENEIIFFNADQLLPKGKVVFLNVAIETINQRIQEATTA